MKLKVGQQYYLSKTDSKGILSKCTLYSIVTKEFASSEEKIYSVLPICGHSVLPTGESPFAHPVEHIHSSKEEALQAIAKANGLTISILKDHNETQS